jgi:hypothetical protein
LHLPEAFKGSHRSATAHLTAALTATTIAPSAIAPFAALAVGAAALADAAEGVGEFHARLCAA